ncbi:MAG: hypothetical protein K2O40_14010 [Lachnospiraceae bacterium]|nr:hypothetical protein [Lachnospiraceae bacterium]
MVITEAIQKSMQHAQEDLAKNAKEYRRQFAEKMEKSQGDFYECSGESEFHYFTYDKNLMQEAMHQGMRGDYLREMQNCQKEYARGVYTNGSSHDFLTDFTKNTYAYAKVYQAIVNGHADGSRKRYQYDKELGKMREMTLEEELSLLDQDYKDLISLETFSMISQMYAQKTLKFYNKPYISEQYDREQMKAYIEDSGAAIKNCFAGRYDKNPTQAVKDIKSIVTEVLCDNKPMFEYCTALNAQIHYIGGNTGGQ